MQPYEPFLNWIDHQKEHMIRLVTSWSEINSHSFNQEGVQQMLQALKKQFSRLEGEIQECSLLPVDHIDDNGCHISHPLGKALRITKRRDAKIKLLFSGHMDTVYTKDSPFQKTQRRDENTLIGPGVTDMKGGLCILLTALEAFEKSPYASEIGWEVLITADEEIGSPGSKALLEESAKRHHLGFVFEPSFPDGAMVSERAGSLNMTLIVRGKAAHSGRDFNKGRSAIFAVAPLLVELEALNSKDLIVNVGSLHSGHSSNVVPDLAIAKINLRAYEKDQMQAAKQKIDTLVKRFGEKEGIQMELHESSNRVPKKVDAPTEKILGYLTECAHALGHTLEKRASGGVSDGNILAANGLAIIDAIGAIGGEIHSPREYLLLDSLPQRAKLITLFLMKIANAEFSIASKTKPTPIAL
ncbi:MAG: hypothetical protein JWO53_901 [Chlamydiia bacterium]|nr:hypothetical protein [Chlamydiia bacterium]